MFHVGGHKGVNTRGRSSGLRSSRYPHLLNHVDWKGPLRCGIVFCTISCILFVIGVILTWLGIRRTGVHDVFGEKVPITGPILLAVGGLMLLLALRQFYMAHVRKKAHNKALENKELGEKATAAITEQDEDQDFNEGEADINQNKGELDDPSGNCIGDTSEKPPLISGGYYDSDAVTSSYGDPLHTGGYVWPHVPLPHPYFSMAMMVYKDPALISVPYLSPPGYTGTCSAGPVVAGGVGMYEVRDTSEAAASGSLSSPSPYQKQNTAVLEAPSTTLEQQTLNASCSSPASVSGSRHECSRIFPADYLTSHQRRSNTPSSASAGISNLPNRTAFMMLRTLELQETI